MAGNGADDEFTPHPPFAVRHVDNERPCRAIGDLTLSLHALRIEIANMESPLGRPGWARVADGLEVTVSIIREAVK